MSTKTKTYGPVEDIAPELQGAAAELAASAQAHAEGVEAAQRAEADVAARAYALLCADVREGKPSRGWASYLEEAGEL